MFSAFCVIAMSLDLGGVADVGRGLGPETPPLPPGTSGGMREDEATAGMAAAGPNTTAPTTAAPTTAAPTTTAAADTTATTTAAPTTTGDCIDDNGKLSTVTEGELDSCAVGASPTFGLCADEDFVALCCASCKTAEKGPAAGSCSDDDELLAQASGGQIASCEEAVEYCYDADVQALCCRTCSGKGTTVAPPGTTPVPAAPKPLMDPALAAVQAATAVADKKKDAARIAVAAADAAAEAAEAAQSAAQEAMNAMVQSNTKPESGKSAASTVEVPNEVESTNPYMISFGGGSQAPSGLAAYGHPRK